MHPLDSIKIAQQSTLSNDNIIQTAKRLYSNVMTSHTNIEYIYY